MEAIPCGSGFQIQVSETEFHMFSNNALALDFYGVYVVVDGATYTYRCFSLNHAHALETATAAHIAACGMLPLPNKIEVVGPCHNSDCNCGRIFTLEADRLETEDLGLMN